MPKYDTLHQAITLAVAACDCELWGIERTFSEKLPVVRVYIEKPTASGVSVQDCAEVSRQIRAVLMVEAPEMLVHDRIEVSSPGVERRLFSRAHYAQFLNNRVHIRLKKGQCVHNRRHYEGVLVGVEASCVTLRLLEPLDGQSAPDVHIELPFSSIDCARLVVY